MAWRNPLDGHRTGRQSGGRIYVLEPEAETNRVIARFEAVVSRAREFGFHVAPPPRAD